MLGRGRLFAVERCSPFLFFFLPQTWLKGWIMSQPASCCMTNSSSSTVGGYFFFKSLVPLEHRGFRALILLLLLSFVSCCRWGPSFLPCCSLVLLPTTPFLTGAFYFFPCLVQDAFLFFLPLFYVIVASRADKHFACCLWHKSRQLHTGFVSLGAYEWPRRMNRCPCACGWLVSLKCQHVTGCWEVSSSTGCPAKTDKNTPLVNS